MKLRFIVAALAALIAPACAIAEQQTPAHTPQVSETHDAWNARFPTTKQNLDNFNKFELNPALRALASNNYGSSCSAVPTPYPGQICIDATERAVKVYTAPVGSSVFSWNTLALIGSDGKLSQSGALNFKGSWNATTNSPALVSSTGTAGDYYVVTTAGTTTLNGVSSWAIGDQAVFSSGAWIKIPGASPVQSVAGLTGTIGATPLKTALAIGVADVSGALGSSNPNFTGDMTASTPGGGYIGNYLFLQGAGNAVYFYTGGAGTDSKEWRIYPDATQLHFSLDNDAQTPILDWLKVTRVGVASATATANAAFTFTLPITGSFGPPAGVVADGTTDVAAALNAALATGDVTLPSSSSFYRAASTIIVPFKSTLRGIGNASLQASGSTAGGARIVCDAGVSPCIQVGTGNFNTMASVYNITQSRAGGTPAAGTIGVWVFGGDNQRLVDVTSDNNGICFLWGRSTPGSGAGISNFGTRLTSTRCSSAHHSFDGIPDVRISDSHVGANGNTDYHASAAFRFTCTQHNCSGAGATNTIVVHNTQVNQASHSIDHFAEFVDAGPSFSGADFGDITFSDVHAEVVNNAFYSDSSWLQIKHVTILGSIINTSVTSADGPGGRFFKLDPATSIYKWNLIGNNFFAIDEGGVAAYRIAAAPASGPGIGELHWIGGTVSGNVYLTGFNNSTTWINGVSFNDNLTFDGSFQVLSEIGDNIGGTYFEGASGGQTIFNNRAIKVGGNVGVDCSSGITAGTYRSVKGITTHC